MTFDPITGSFDRINFTGKHGEALRDTWFGGPKTYLGLQTHGFPNLTTLAGPQSGSVGTTFPRGIEDAIVWTTGLLKYLQEHDYGRVEARQEAEEAWTDRVKQAYDGLLLADVKSWSNGYSSNVEGYDVPRYLGYFGEAPDDRNRLTEITAVDYEGFEFA